MRKGSYLWKALPLLLVAFFSLGASAKAADTIETVTAKPLAQQLTNTTPKPIKPGVLRVPTITWPGDVSTVSAEKDLQELFKKQGLNVELFCENDFAKQVQGVINGETPFLRGTMGMGNSAAEVVDLVAVYQLTWSNGGDCLVVRPGINNLTDLKGKTIAIQLYGPHMDFLTTILARAGLTPADVNIKWFKELTIPTYDTKGKIVDPRSAFFADNGIDACFVISPDAAALTSGGAEGVAGSKILFSSKSANRIISDVYFVRKDWFDANKDKVEQFVHTLMVAQEKFDGLVANKSTKATEFGALMTRSADLLFGSPQATGDVEGSLVDCEWVGFQGNVRFFTGEGTIRNFTVLTDEIQTSFIQLGLLKAKATVGTANWDYTKLANGLKNVDLTAVPKPALDTAKVQQAVENQIATELDTWEEEGTLYFFEIYFDPRQTEFPAAQYKDAYKKAMELSQTFGGALVTIEGHNAPDALNKAKKEGKPATYINMIEQAAKNVAYQRAVSARDAYIQYCKDNKLVIDESQVLAVGMGVKSPKFPVPSTKQEWDANRRVVFRVKVIETELDTFQPMN